MSKKTFVLKKYCEDKVFDRERKSSILFGSREYFGIEVTYDVDIIINTEVIREFAYYEHMKGQVKLWVKGKNILEYDFPGEDATYWAELNGFVECFTTDLLTHLKEEPFPFKTKSSHAREIDIETAIAKVGEDQIEKFCELSDSEIEDMSLMGDWLCPRSLGRYAFGSYLPDVFFQRVGNNIEISWHALEPFKADWGEFWQTHRKGVEYIDVETYKTIVLEFCQSYCNKFKDKYPEIIKKHQDRLDILLKKLG